jgi:quinol-cytochrome oxidoreductase complex cytochrome b subunit
VSEIIMNKNPIQSNLPEFKPSSMTSERLHQHPVPSPKPHWLSNFSALLLLISIFIGLAAMFTYAADREAAYQAEAIAKAVGGAK